MTTGINYLDETWSPVTGCSGKGCKVRDDCWAKAMVKRFPAIHEPESLEHPGIGIPFSRVQFHPDRLDKPLHWRKPLRIGVCFTGDWMDDQVQCEWIDQILEVIAACPQHQFFSLTKQPQNLEEKIYGHCPESAIRELGGGDYLPNLWNGVSITDQEDWNSKKHDFLRIPGRKWISYEPAMQRVFFGPDLYQVDWLVIGCESGKNRRPMPLEWAIDVVEQCKAAGVPVWVKQISLNGKVVHDINLFPPELQVRQMP